MYPFFQILIVSLSEFRHHFSGVYFDLLFSVSTNEVNFDFVKTVPFLSLTFWVFFIVIFHDPNEIHPTANIGNQVFYVFDFALAMSTLLCCYSSEYIWQLFSGYHSAIPCFPNYRSKWLW